MINRLEISTNCFSTSVICAALVSYRHVCKILKFYHSGIKLDTNKQTKYSRIVQRHSLLNFWCNTSSMNFSRLLANLTNQLSLNSHSVCSLFRITISQNLRRLQKASFNSLHAGKFFKYIFLSKDEKNHCFFPKYFADI